MSRAAALARGLTVGYGYQAVVALTGLALTPFLLGRLGADDYGRWLVAGQVLGLLTLLDLGVAALVPREVARATGGEDPTAAGEVVGRARRLILVQTPVVAVVAAGAWAWAAAARPEVAGPLAVVLAGFVVQFPLRLPAAVLAGLQDLAYTGVAQAVGWAVATALTVGLVAAGCGLYALAAGWAVGQLVGCGLAWRRLRAKFPAVAGAGGGWAGAWGQLRASLWVGLAQLAQVLTAGTDLLVVGWALGPAAAVAYGCTVKLVAVLTNPCYAVALAAQPAVAQLATAGDPARLRAALRAVGLAVLVAGGGVAVAVAGANAAFVSAWVGPERYAGAPVTLLALAAMLARQLAFAWWSAAYALGAERRLSLALVADGLVTVAAAVGWVALLGPVGAPLGSLTGAALVYLPSGLVTLAGRLGVSVRDVAGWARPWAVRFAVVVAPVAAFALSPAAADLRAAVPVAAAGGLAYLALAYGLAAEPPLRGYRDRAAAAVGRMAGRFSLVSRGGHTPRAKPFPRPQESVSE